MWYWQLSFFLSKLTSCGTLIKHIQRNWTGQTVDFKNDFKMESGKYIYCNFDVALDIWTVVFRGGKTSSNMKVPSKILWENQKQAVASTVFAHCLNTFWKTSLIVPKLYTQVNMTQHWEIYHSHLCQIETLLSKPKLCYQNLTILCQNVTLMTKWHILASYAYTFRSGGTH